MLAFSFLCYLIGGLSPVKLGSAGMLLQGAGVRESFSTDVSSESGAGGRRGERGLRRLHTPHRACSLRRLPAGAPAEELPSASASTPRALAEAQSVTTPQSSSPSSPPPHVTVCSRGRRQVCTVAVGEKVDHETALLEHIMFPRSFGRWTFCSLLEDGK